MGVSNKSSSNEDCCVVWISVAASCLREEPQNRSLVLRRRRVWGKGARREALTPERLAAIMQPQPTLAPRITPRRLPLAWHPPYTSCIDARSFKWIVEAWMRSSRFFSFKSSVAGSQPRRRSKALRAWRGPLPPPPISCRCAAACGSRQSGSGSSSVPGSSAIWFSRPRHEANSDICGACSQRTAVCRRAGPMLV
jgi:hypothetical protein